MELWIPVITGALSLLGGYLTARWQFKTAENKTEFDERKLYLDGNKDLVSTLTEQVKQNNNLLSEKDKKEDQLLTDIGELRGMVKILKEENSELMRSVAMLSEEKAQLKSAISALTKRIEECLELQKSGHTSS